MSSYVYYELRGLGESSTTQMPSGMFRVVKTENDLLYEKVTLEGIWVEDSSLIRHLAGYSDEAKKISEKKADEFLAYLRSGQAAIDKARGSWR